MRKIFSREEVIKNSVGNLRLHPLLASGTVFANSHSEMWLSLDLAKGRCVVLRSKVRREASVFGVLFWALDHSRPWL